MAVAGTVTRSVSTANSLSPAAVAKPTGVADNDTLVAVITIPTLAGTSSVVTPPSGEGWVEIGHFHAPAASAIGVTQAWFMKPIPVAAAESQTTYVFTGTNVAAARSLAQMFRMTGRVRSATGVVTASSSRSTSVATTPTGTVTPTGLDDWDILYSGSTRSNNTFTGPDTELDDYVPAANTSSAIYALTGQAAGTYSKTVTASTASSTGLGVIVAIPKYVAPVIPSPWRVRGPGGAPVIADLYVRGSSGAPVKITVV